MQTLVCFMLSPKSHKLSSLLRFFSCMFQWIPLPCFQVHCFFLLLHLTFNWTFLVHFFISLIALFSSVTHVWYILIFLSLIWSSYCVHLFFSWAGWESFWPLAWIFYQVNYLSVSLCIFPWGFILFYLEHVFLFCLFISIDTLCWFHVLDEITSACSLEGVLYVRDKTCHYILL